MVEPGLRVLTTISRRWLWTDVTLLMTSLLALTYFLSRLNPTAFTLVQTVIIGGVLVLVALIFLLYRRKHLTPLLVSSALDRTLPELEESSSLFLKPTIDLNLLESLQQDKIEPILNRAAKNPSLYFRRLNWTAIGFTVLSLVIGAMVRRFQLPLTHGLHPARRTSNRPVFKPAMPKINSFRIMVAPPAYTGHKKHESSGFALQVEAGSTVSWNIQLNRPVLQAYFLLNGTIKRPLVSVGDPLSYRLEQKISASGFYQIALNDTLSTLYPLNILVDHPPKIEVMEPRPETRVERVHIRDIQLKANVSDDYGVKRVQLWTTVTKGSGEAITFNNQVFTFTLSPSGPIPKVRIQKSLNLAALGMQPGDHLYFYLVAEDNYPQQTKSEVYTIAIIDSAQNLRLEGLVSGLRQKPAYFRSQRQIILDSEKLMKEKKSLRPDLFNQRSNELGVDQKILRMRYGQFLGEEEESGRPENTPDGNLPVQPPADFGNGQKIKDAYTDKHDQAEDASYFDAGSKAELKATLAEMWSAELQLRMNQPQKALPYEYRALRILKDLQQKSRTYVAKTTLAVKVGPFKDRLSGDLTKIHPIRIHHLVTLPREERFMYQIALLALEELIASGERSDSTRKLYQSILPHLRVKAAGSPDRYLAALRILTRLAGDGPLPSTREILWLESRLEGLIPIPGRIPQSNTLAPDKGLSDQYFQKLP